MLHKLTPKDHGEAVALFRAQVIGPVLSRTLPRGQLSAELRHLSAQRFSPPGTRATRRYSVGTLKRWLAAYREGGLEGLRPKSRRRGHALALNEELRTLIVEIRREYPGASVPLIVQTLVEEGRLREDEVQESALRRMLADHGLDRRSLGRSDGRDRRRWVAAHPGEIWHADVCHGPARSHGKTTTPLKVHGICDDASRYLPALQARSSEREADMIELFLLALREHGKPETLYVDNGATYRGELLRLICGRLGIALVHAKPYDPQARGKMERFWRTLRAGCLDYVRPEHSLHDVQVRLVAFLERRYHDAPHAGLLGRSPRSVWRSRQLPRVTEEELRVALTIRESRQLRGDGTLTIGGAEWEPEHGFLAGKTVTVARTLADPQASPWIEEGNKRLKLRRVDPRANAGRKRKRKTKRVRRGLDAIDFDPPSAFVDALVGRRRPRKGGK
jgi:transposase InsO family protein